MCARMGKLRLSFSAGLPMANDNAPSTNREITEVAALAIVFGGKSAPLVPTSYAGKTGSVTFSSVRSALKTSEPALVGNALTARVNAIKNECDSAVLAGVLQLHREGFHFTRFNGRELKNGARTVSVAMTNAADAKAMPAKKIGDYTAAELRELAILADAAEKAAATPTIDV